MPVTPTYPGVYIEEVPSGVRPITGVATSITAFVGFARRGPVNEPDDRAELPRVRPGCSAGSGNEHDELRRAAVLPERRPRRADRPRRAASGGGTLATQGTVTVGGGGAQNLMLDRRQRGCVVGTISACGSTTTQATGSRRSSTSRSRTSSTGVVEMVRNLPLDATAARSHRAQSTLVRATATPTARPDQARRRGADRASDPFDPTVPARFSPIGAGVDGDPGRDRQSSRGRQRAGHVRARAGRPLQSPLHPARPAGERCRRRPRALVRGQGPRRGVLLAEPRALRRRSAPGLGRPGPDHGAATRLRPTSTASRAADRRNAAHLLPLPQRSRPARGRAVIADFPPCGAIAGVMARTDATRGVWKAPAGLEAGICGRPGAEGEAHRRRERDPQPARASTACGRSRVVGHVVWGARTLAGRGRARRRSGSTSRCGGLALFIEESLYRGTQWVVFEPNDEPLWAQIRLNVGAFMHNLFRQGAFQGKTPREAYLVKCDKETTTQTDINNGRREHPRRIRPAQAGRVRDHQDPAARRADRDRMEGELRWPSSA